MASDKNETNSLLSEKYALNFEPDWCGELKFSPIFGNHIVAKRSIEPGELVLEELPLVQAPAWDLEPTVSENATKKIFICLNCYKEVTELEKCSQCQWPLCKNCISENASIHSTECRILVANDILPNGKAIDYYGIKILRYLLIRDAEPAKWAKLLSLEPHIEERGKSDMPRELTTKLTEIVRRCGLDDFSDAVIDHMIGVFEVNPFWSENNLKSTPVRHASLLFGLGSLFTHSCSPNTKREILERTNQDKNGIEKHEMFLRVTAVDRIEMGESITINYIKLDQTYEERQKILKVLFYFECCCQRCNCEKPT